MPRVYFPLDCHATSVRVTLAFGEPYPQDAEVNNITKFYITKVIDYFKFLKLYENDFSNNNIFPSLSTFSPSLQNYEGRANLLKYLTKRHYDSSTSFVVRTKMDYYYLNLFPVSNFRGYLQNISFHPGVDLTINNSSNTVGKLVYAVSDGVVRKAGNNWCRNNGCGGYVVIEHRTENATFYALYGHITPTVRVGATVVGGSVIGSVGNISSFPPHLHFETTIRYIYDQYPSYPYKQYYLSALLLGAYLFDYSSSSPTPRIDLNSPTIQVPYPIYRGMIVSRSWDITKDPDVNLSAFSEEKGFIDPIKFLQKSCNNKVFSSSTNTPCMPFNFIDNKCFNDICVTLRK